MMLLSYMLVSWIFSMFLFVTDHEMEAGLFALAAAIFAHASTNKKRE